MADKYRVEFRGLTEQQAFRIKDLVDEKFGVLSFRVFRNDDVVMAGTPNIPKDGQRKG